MSLIRPIRTCAILSALVLAGCQTVAGDAEAVICTSFQPISYSRLDTELTREQILEFNAALAAICPRP